MPVMPLISQLFLDVCGKHGILARLGNLGHFDDKIEKRSQFYILYA
jgi:hypothetical protein